MNGFDNLNNTGMSRFDNLNNDFKNQSQDLRQTMDHLSNIQNNINKQDINVDYNSTSLEAPRDILGSKGELGEKRPLGDKPDLGMNGEVNYGNSEQFRHDNPTVNKMENINNII